jgi:hypothetical protein
MLYKKHSESGFWLERFSFSQKYLFVLYSPTNLTKLMVSSMAQTNTYFSMTANLSAVVYQTLPKQIEWQTLTCSATTLCQKQGSSVPGTVLFFCSYIFLIEKKPWAGTAEWKRTERLASGGRDTNSSMHRLLTSPAAWRSLFRKYLSDFWLDVVAAPIPLALPAMDCWLFKASGW